MRTSNGRPSPQITHVSGSGGSGSAAGPSHAWKSVTSGTRCAKSATASAGISNVRSFRPGGQSAAPNRPAAATPAASRRVPGAAFRVGREEGARHQLHGTGQAAHVAHERGPGVPQDEPEPEVLQAAVEPADQAGEEPAVEDHGARRRLADEQHLRHPRHEPPGRASNAARVTSPPMLCATTGCLSAPVASRALSRAYRRRIPRASGCPGASRSRRRMPCLRRRCPGGA